MTATLGDALVHSLAWEHERVHLVRDAQTGLCAAIAIHSTVLGPALGGLRIRRYQGGLPEALDDVLRLSRAMTLKAATAGLDLGGGKAVVLDDGLDELRSSRLAVLATEIDRLGGDYITAEDIGTTPADMDLIAEHTAYVVGRSEHGEVSGDPSPDTARTVLGAIRAALLALDGAEDLHGRTVGVIGLGKVGGRLARWLIQEGARVVGFDPRADVLGPARAAGVEIAPSADDVFGRELDVLAPCAVGGMIDERRAESLRCRIVCGAANNQLENEATARVLGQRQILYVPDFMANCGGLIHADAERRGAEAADVERALQEAARRTRDVLAEAQRTGALPLAVAEEHAWVRIRNARRALSAPVPPPVAEPVAASRVRSPDA
jgi:glutamate dehydrogenase/leucine dehydrogenase